MSYTDTNFQTKKGLKDALAAGREIRVFNPGFGPNLSNYTGDVFLEGPHYPQPHRWYAQGKMVGGKLVSIR